MILLALVCLWALAATVTAFLPMRWQMAPGLLLMAAAPVLIVALGVVYGGWAAAAAAAGFVSMFRRPLGYLALKLARWFGQRRGR